MAKGCTRRHRDCGMWPCACQEMCCLMECSPGALSFPCLLLWAMEALLLPKNRSLQAKGLCVLRIQGCLKLQTVLHNQLTATKAPEKPPMASVIAALVHWVRKWRKSMPEKANGKETAQPQWDSERYPSICMGCKSVILHQSHAAQEEVNAGNETQDFIWHVLTEYIDTLHKILWKEITCVSTSINTCPITTQLSVMALLTRGQWIYVCHLNISSTSIKKPLWD